MATIPTTTYTTVQKVVQFLNNYTAVQSQTSAGGEAIGTGDGATTTFYLLNKKVVQSTEQIYVAGTLKTVTTHYTIDYDSGTITFTAGNIPTAGQAITGNYWYSDLYSSLVGAYVVRAEDEINRRVGRSFYASASTTETYNGDAVQDQSFFSYSQGGDFLEISSAIKPGQEFFFKKKMLPLNYYPVLTVTALSIDGTALSASDYSIVSNPGYILLTPTGGLEFSLGSQNIVISYTYGYATVPSVVEQLATKMAAIYVIESRLFGDPGQSLDIKKQNIDIVRTDIERMFQSLGEKLEAIRI